MPRYDLTENPWTEREIETLRAGWCAGKARAELALRLGRSPNSITGKVNRMREREGEARWPSRPSPIRKGPEAPPYRRRNGGGGPVGPTLPPLGSLG